MNNISKSIQNDDGTNSTLIITSNDNYSLNMSQNYRLANHTPKKESKIAKKFKGSLLGTDVGVKSSGFTSIAILSVVIGLSAVIIMYLFWRF